MPGTLAEELERASGRRRSRYWTYDVVTHSESDVGFSTNDLGNKWGNVDGNPEEPRRTRSGRVRRDPVPDSGPLSRRIADLHHHFTRNVENFTDNQTIPGEYPNNSPWREVTATAPDESRLTTPAPDISARNFSGDLSHLSGELVDNESEWRSSGELAHNDSRLSGELAPRDLSGELVPSIENQLGVDLEGGSLILHPNLSHRKQTTSSGEEDKQDAMHNRADASLDDDGSLSDLEYFPVQASDPPRLPEIDTSDEEDLVNEFLSKLRDISDVEYEQINTMAVIVEVKEENAKKGASSPAFTTKMEGATAREHKGKKLDPLETGPRYSEFRSKVGKQNVSKTNSLFHQRPEHFRRDDSEKPEGGWFRATTKKANQSSPPYSSDSGSDNGNGHGPPSPPGPDSSDDENSDASDASARKRKHGHEKGSKRPNMTNIKMKDPFKYNGTADLDTFDHIRKTPLWLIRLGALTHLSCRLLGYFMSCVSDTCLIYL